MIYTTKAGTVVEVGSVHRSAIDALIYDSPMPEPPTRTVSVWGNETEEVPDYNNRDYIAEHRVYLANFGKNQISIIAPAIKVRVSASEQEISELSEIGIPSDLAFLSEHIFQNADDMAAIIELIFYQSTVTVRGVDEAEKRFNVTFAGRPVGAWKPPGSQAKQSQYFVDWQVARSCGYSWERFCELDGRKQSECVAYYLISLRLDWLMKKFG